MLGPQGLDAGTLRPWPGKSLRTPRARRKEGRRRGTCFWPQQGAEELAATRVQAAGHPDAGGAGGSSSPGRSRRLGEAPGRRRGARSRRGLGPHSPPTSRRRSPGAAPSGPGRLTWLLPGACPPTGGPGRRRQEGKKEGRRERRKGRREGRGGVAAEEAGAAGPGGGERKGEPNLTRPPPAQTLRSRSGARSPAGSDGGGAYARPAAPARLPLGPTPRPRSGPQIPAGSAAAPALVRPAA